LKKMERACIDDGSRVILKREWEIHQKGRFCIG